MKQTISRFLMECVERKNLDRRVMQARIDRLGARHGLVSAVLSPDDEPSRPNDRLLDLAESLIRRCRSITLDHFADRFSRRPAPFFDLWPGEHYRVLAALVQLLEVRHAVELGTYTGLSSLAVLPFLPPGGSLTTFDVIAWDQLPDTHLRADDFKPGRLEQKLADLSDVDVALGQTDLLRRADLIFVDAAKDGVQEQRFLDNFERIGLRTGTVLVFDDIRIWNMLAIWRRIRRPKLDFTSFGHFTGTGIVLWE